MPVSKPKPKKKLNNLSYGCGPLPIRKASPITAPVSDQVVLLAPDVVPEPEPVVLPVLVAAPVALPRPPLIDPSQLVQKKKPKPVPVKKPRPVRPSLSDQLASIGDKASSLTSDIKKMSKNYSGSSGVDEEASRYSCPAGSFSVGTLRCRYPSPIDFFDTRCEYTFHHPYENTEIRMHMHYRDMLDFSIKGNNIRFRLHSKLLHFSADYDPTNSTHAITIELSSAFSVQQIRDLVGPCIRNCIKGR